MVSLAPLGLPVDDGLGLLSALTEQGTEVLAAGWIRVIDDDRYLLCIVTEPGRNNLLEQYHAVGDTLRSLAPTRVRLDEVNILRPDEPLGAGLIQLRRLYPGVNTAVFAASSVGRVGVQGPVVLYPVSPILTPTA